MIHQDLLLKKREDRRIRQGHLWVFSNEVNTTLTPLHYFSPGDWVNVRDAGGQVLGSAYINPNSLICARLFSHNSDVNLDHDFFRQRLNQALALRELFFDRPYYRLVFGESDGLPGLVIDRFGDVLSVQITTAGMENVKTVLLEVLIEILAPEVVILKNDSQQRTLENLSLDNEVVYGTLDELVHLEENTLQFEIDLLGGQKTGWFYDHRMSRAKLANLASGKKVLDLFCYAGGWSLPAAKAGAIQVTAVDSSASALEMASNSAALNGLTQLEFVRSDVFDFLKQARTSGQRYDVIVLDPPALIKRKKDFKAGFEAYRRLNQLALQLLNDNGLLVSASCSYHLSRDNLHDILRSSARNLNRHVLFTATCGQGPDHPVHPAIPESEYLKTYFCSVTGGL
jgi:23S rRNA (cytosine1962-C5)-methyltransferase